MSRQRRAVIVCGQIGSGKTTIATAVVMRHDWHLVSFGWHVRRVAAHIGTGADRASLQALGAHIVGELGADKFILQVLESEAPAVPNHVYDGVRHLSVLAALRRAYDSTLVLYLDVVEDARRHRWSTRRASHDRDVSIDAFRIANEHPVESETILLRREADVVLDANAAVSQVVAAVEQELAARFGGNGGSS
jgi:dephospho-CoA kinase